MTKTKTLCINLQRTLAPSGVQFLTLEQLHQHGVGVDNFRAQLEDDFSVYWPAVTDVFYSLRKELTELAIDLFVDKLLKYADYESAIYTVPYWVGWDSRVLLKEYGRNIINHPHGVQS